MGAVTALLYAERDLSIAAMVLDSPFADLKQLVKDLARTQSNVPNFLISGALKFVKKSVKKRAGFDLTNVKPFVHAEHCYVPALFGVAKDDELVSPQNHGEVLYHRYAGEKYLAKFEGKHNDSRPEFFMIQAADFLETHLKSPTIIQQPPTFSEPRKLSVIKKHKS